MKNVLLFSIALAVVCMSIGYDRHSASAMSYLTPANVTTACTVAVAVEGAVLADETLANQIANKRVVGTTGTTVVYNVTPALCSQITAIAAAATAAATPAK